MSENAKFLIAILSTCLVLIVTYCVVKTIFDIGYNRALYDIRNSGYVVEEHVTFTNSYYSVEKEVK